MRIMLKHNKARDMWLVCNPETGRTMQETENCDNVPLFFNCAADPNFVYLIDVDCRLISVTERCDTQ
jgi:hypothetical protein